MRSKVRTDLLETAKSLALSPGVYLMKDTDEQVIYVGKAKSLKNRVSSYFQPITHEHPRTEMMISRVNRFEVIHTETEKEALVLECTLIKRYKPRFNVRLKDDKNYPYLYVPAREEYPRIEWTRKVKSDKGRYFGPFPSAHQARLVLRLLNETYKLRDCSDNTFLHRSRPCILHQMEQCSAPCVKLVTPEQYEEQIKSAASILQGKNAGFIRGLKQKMMVYAGEERYEEAAFLRDQIQAIEVIAETQSVLDADKNLSIDVFSIEQFEGVAHGVVLQVRGGKLLMVKHYDVQNFDGSMSRTEVMRDFLTQHFLMMTHASDLLKVTTVLMNEEPDDKEMLEGALNISIKTPRGETEKQLVKVAQTNAKYAAESTKRSEASHGAEALKEAQEKLSLENLPRRIECYDISNTQGEESVASRVVFIDGTPEKNLYRKYKIKTVIGANDFASMREIFERRFSKMDERVGDERPDLVVVDGGRGQLSQAEAIFKDLGISRVDLVGLAKARTESDFQSQEVKSSDERIFIPNRVNPVPLMPHTKTFKLLTHIRNEAHRFAITYHRNLRHKKSMGTNKRA